MSFKINQITKFYIASFLKNQTYFVPVFVVLLEFYHLTLSEIFLVIAIGNAVSFIAEIPTGVFADHYGKKKSLILARFLILIAFIVYGLSKDFWIFVLAESIYKLGNSFRTGTEVAYIYDYIEQKKPKATYAEVKGKQKFYARIGEAIASLAGGFIAAKLGLNYVFFISAIPVFINLLFTLTWIDIKETKQNLSIANSVSHLKKSFSDICKSDLLKITLNITFFTAILLSALTFLQPYMQELNIPIELFGVIYSVSLFISAIAVRYAYVIEKKFGEIRSINRLTFLAIVPLFILGLGYSSILGIALFFLLIIIENFRSPIANSLFHEKITSERRATLGSILSQAKSLGNMALLPLVGVIANKNSVATALLFLGGLMICNWIFFKIKK